VKKRGKAFQPEPDHVIYLSNVYRWKDRGAETVEVRKTYYPKSQNIYWAMVRPYGGSRHTEVVRRLKAKEA
jgi:hypothetical protein